MRSAFWRLSSCVTRQRERVVDNGPQRRHLAAQFERAVFELGDVREILDQMRELIELPIDDDSRRA